MTDVPVFLQLTDKLVEKVGVQRTPAANPEMYKSDDYSAHLKGDNRTVMQRDNETAGRFFPYFTAYVRAASRFRGSCYDA